MRSASLFAVAVLTIVLAMTGTPAYATVTTITPSSADTLISAFNPTTNWGTSQNFYVQGCVTFGPVRSLVKFDLSSIPSGYAINTASLQLYYYAQSGPTNPVGRTIVANRVTTDWAEGTCNGCTPVLPNHGATWLKPDAPTSSNWGSAGGDFTPTGAASQTVPATYGYMTWDVTTIVKAWIEGGQPNYGFLIKDQNEGGTCGGPFFYAKEWVNSMPHVPILTVDYSLPAAVGGTVTSPGLMSGFLAMLPWLLVAVVAVGAGAYAMRKRYASPLLARIR